MAKPPSLTDPGRLNYRVKILRTFLLSIDLITFFVVGISRGEILSARKGRRLQRITSLYDQSEAELEELCRIASEVPSLWEHEAVTYQERQQILGCLIDHIVVTADRKRVDATIVWKAGAGTPL